MHANARNLSRVFQPRVLPGLPTISRFVNAVTVRDVAADWRFAHADIDRVRIRIRQTNRADRTRAENRSVADRLPIDAAVDRLPNTAARAAEIKNHWLGRDARDRG